LNDEVVSPKILKSKIAWRDFLPALILVSNALVWYTLTYQAYSSVVGGLPTGSESLLLFLVYYMGIAFSAIFGAVLFRRFRDNGLLLWMLGGAAMTALLATVPNNTMAINLLVSVLLGVSIGIGLPSCLAYFADATRVENRGICGGIIWGTVGFGVLLLGLLLNAFNLVLAFVALAVWRMFGLFGFLFTRSKRRSQVARISPAYRSILRRRDMILYLVPWIMFSLVNFTETPILENLLGSIYVTTIFIEGALTGIFAIVGGFLADLVGRKRVVITGFVVLGIGYAVLSLSPDLAASWYLYTAFDGIAWGMFAAVFFMTLWGDLGEDYEKAKYYAIGGLPYLLASVLPIIIKPYLPLNATGAAFSLASFFLFVAVLPLIYAPETLPEKEIRDRERRDYLEKAKKVKEKYA